MDEGSGQLYCPETTKKEKHSQLSNDFQDSKNALSYLMKCSGTGTFGEMDKDSCSVVHFGK